MKATRTKGNVFNQDITNTRQCQIKKQIQNQDKINPEAKIQEKAKEHRNICSRNFQFSGCKQV